MFTLSKIGGTDLSRSVFSKRLRNFASDCSGNVGMTFALVLLPVLISIGAATDFTKMSMQVSSAQDYADAAVLNAAHEYYKNYSRNSAKDTGDIASNYHLDANGALDEYLVETVVSESDEFSVTLKSTISSTAQHAFMGLVGNSETPFTVTSYSVVSIPRIEIILVIDASNSMQGERLTQLKLSLDKFIDDVAPYRIGDSHIAITLLPYAEYVNFGAGSDQWLHPSSGPQDATTFNGCFISSAPEHPGGMYSAVYGARKRLDRPFCPDSDSESVLFSTDSKALKKRIQDLTLGWGTHSVRAMLWGERMLDNTWRNSARGFAANPPVEVTDSTQKIVVLLTDGEVAITDPDEDGVALKTPKVLARIPAALEKFVLQCQAFKKFQTLDIYTVAYTVRSERLEAAMRECVTGNGDYFEAGIGDLDAVFKRVSSSLSAIRISK